MKVSFLDLDRINGRFILDFQNKLSTIINSGWVLQGKFTSIFEKEFSFFCNSRYTIGVANGLDALTLILLAQKQLQGWKEDDEVLVPTHTFVASAQAIIRAGLKPVFVDIQLSDFLIDINKLNKSLTNKTRAVMPIHLYGRCCDIELLQKWARQYQLFIVEDAAQAHGAFYPNTLNPVGSAGNPTAFSFYPGKNLGAIGDGGAVVCNDPELAHRIRVLANYGSSQKYHHHLEGVNSRLDEIQAAFLSVKLPFLRRDNLCRQKIAERYFKEIKNPLINLPYDSDNKRIKNSVFHIFPILSEYRSALQKYLSQKEITTLIHYPIPLHQQLCFKEKHQCYLMLSNAERIAHRELSLPIHPMMSSYEVDYVIQTLNQFRI